MLRNRRICTLTDDKPWWLAGGIPSQNCIAAYQPRGAESLASSYINRANPGTYNAAPGTDPLWDVLNGWKFAHASKQFLVTTITPTSLGWTYIFKYTNYSYNAYAAFFGGYTSATTSTLYEPYNLITRCYVYNGAGLQVNSTLPASGVHALSNKKLYWDGQLLVTIADGGNPSDVAFHIGKYNGATDSFTGTFYMQAMAIYDIELSLSGVQALTNAMNAL